MFAQIDIMTLEGQQAAILTERHYDSGVHELPLALYEHPHLANGQYFLRLTIEGNTQQTLPFIIQR